MILAIETATPICSVALGENEEITVEISTNIPQSHSSLINNQIREALTKANKKLKDLKAIAVSLGPGSYTGLRIGLSAAKGFSYALNIPIIGIPTLQSMTKQAVDQLNNEDAFYIPMIDARRGEVYTGVFDQHLNETVPSQAHILNGQSFDKLTQNRPSYIFGTGAKKAMQILNEDRFSIINNFQISAIGIAKLAFDKYKRNDFENTAYVEPLYLKAFQSNTK